MEFKNKDDLMGGVDKEGFAVCYVKDNQFIPLAMSVEDFDTLKTMLFATLSQIETSPIKELKTGNIKDWVVE